MDHLSHIPTTVDHARMRSLPSSVALLLGVAISLALAGCSRTADTPSPDEKIATISYGEPVDLDPLLLPDTWTIVEFSAEW